MKKQAVIQFMDFTKKYGKHFAAKNLNITIPEGIVGFLGPNGAGKTTTINCLMGIIHPTWGSASINGHDIILDGKRARRNIGFLPERNFIFPSESAVAWLKHLGRLIGLRGRRLAERVFAVLKIVGIEEKWWKKASKKYSGGMRQRLGFAAAFLNPNNDLIILDEPTSNLDPFGRREILKSIKEMHEKQGVNVFLSSHVLSEVEQICDYIFIINKGRIVSHGKITDLSRLFTQNEYKIKSSDNKRLLEDLESHLDIYSSSISEYDELIIQVKDPKRFQNEFIQILYENKLHLFHFEEISLGLQEIFYRTIDEDLANIETKKGSKYV